MSVRWVLSVSFKNSKLTGFTRIMPRPGASISPIIMKDIEIISGNISRSAALRRTPRALYPSITLQHAATRLSSSQAASGIWLRQLAWVFLCVLSTSLMPVTVSAVIGVCFELAAKLIEDQSLFWISIVSKWIFFCFRGRGCHKIVGAYLGSLWAMTVF